MSGESINDDDDDIHIFDDFNAAVDFLFNPKVNAILMAFPFLRNVPSIYKNGCHRYGKAIPWRRKYDHG